MGHFARHPEVLQPQGKALAVRKTGVGSLLPRVGRKRSSDTQQGQARWRQLCNCHCNESGMFFTPHILAKDPQQPNLCAAPAYYAARPVAQQHQEAYPGYKCHSVEPHEIVHHAFPE